MTKSGTVIWRTSVLLMLIGVVPVGILVDEARRQVDTEAMLDVSVSIRTVSHVTTDQFGDSVWSTGSGSGFLISKSPCEVWTNNHVIAGAAIIEVFPRGWAGTNGIPATVVNANPHHDVAVLEMVRCDDVATVALGDSARMRAGDDTYAVGNPLGNNPDSISRGIVSNVERYLDGTTPYLQTDAATSPGSSGGALFNRRGEVIGMNTAIAATRRGINVGIGYAVPINLVRGVVAELKRGPPSWGDAGLSGVLSPLSADEAAVFQVPGNRPAVSVTETPQGGPSAGKLQARDVIYRIGGVGVEDVAAAVRAIAQHKPGERVAVDVVRAGRPMTVVVELADGWHSEAVPGPDPYPGYLGMSLEMWSNDDPRGAYRSPVITRVQSLGPAHRSLISSSQRAGAMNGPFMMTFQLNVKTISGVVFRGEYHSINAIEPLQEYAASAYESGEPLLVEIQLYGRDNPRALDRPLTHQGAAFYKIVPAPSAAPALDPADDLVANVSG